MSLYFWKFQILLPLTLPTAQTSTTLVLSFYPDPQLGGEWLVTLDLR